MVFSSNNKYYILLCHGFIINMVITQPRHVIKGKSQSSIHDLTPIIILLFYLDAPLAPLYPTVYTVH